VTNVGVEVTHGVPSFQAMQTRCEHQAKAGL
jgi:hypothetical protein